MLDVQTQIKKATHEGKQFLCSVVQKQNQSGTKFNRRLLFVLNNSQLGYISQPRSHNSQIDLQNPKTTFLISQIKKLYLTENILKVVFRLSESPTNQQQKKQNQWIFRMKSNELASKWHSLLSSLKDEANGKRKSLLFGATSSKKGPFSKVSSTSKPSPANKVSPPKQIILLPRRQLKLDKIEQIVIQPCKKQTISKEVAVAASLNIVRKDQPKQTKQIGTIMSHMLDKKIIKPNLSVNQQFRFNLQLKDVQQNNINKNIRAPLNNTKYLQNKSFKAQSQKFKFQDDMPFSQAKDQPQQQLALPQSFPLQFSKVSISSKNRFYQQPSSKAVKLSDYVKKQEQNKSSYYQRTQKLVKKQTESKQLQNGEQKQKQQMKELKTKSSFNRQYKLLSSINTIDKSKIHKPVLNYHKYTSSTPLSALKNEQYKQNHFQLQSSRKPQINLSFIHIEQPSNSNISRSQSSLCSWTYKYLKHKQNMFQQFKQFAQQQAFAFLKNISHSKNNIKYNQELAKRGIYCYKVGDVQIRVATTLQRQSFVQNSDEDATHILLRNQFKNYQALYGYLSPNSRLKVPLVSLCQIKGFTFLFKLIPKTTQRQVSLRELQQQLSALRDVSHIDYDFNEINGQLIVQLDGQYYSKLQEQSDQANFDCFFIQEINSYLLPDMNQSSLSYKHCLRKELIQKYALLLQEKQTQKIPIMKLAMQGSSQLEQLSSKVYQQIQLIAGQMNSMELYFFNSQEIADCLHLKGVNTRYLGKLYQKISLPFQKNIIMSEMIARTCSYFFKKQLQKQVFRASSLSSLTQIAILFLNHLLGYKDQNKDIWQIISQQNKRYFGVPINIEQICKGFLLISLVQNCNLQVQWTKLNPDIIFKTNKLLNKETLLSLKAANKTYQRIFNSKLQIMNKLLNEQQNEYGFQQIITGFQLEYQPLPIELQTHHDRIRKYLTHFIHPQQKNYQHLQLYSQVGLQVPQISHFQMQVVAMRWYLKENQLQKCQNVVNKLIVQISKFYGEYHPFFKQIYELCSRFHLASEAYEDAISFAKSALLNPLHLAGTHSVQTAQSYLFLAQCYVKASRHQQASSYLSKAKTIYQSSSKKESSGYAMTHLCLAIIELQNQNTQKCIHSTFVALEFYEQLGMNQFENELVECYQVAQKCYQLMQNTQSIRRLSERCAFQLKHIKDHFNLQKMLRMILRSKLSSIDTRIAECFLQIISELSLFHKEEHYAQSVQLLRQRIAQDSLLVCLQNYLVKIQDIKSFIEEGNLLQNWASFSDFYQRKTVKDFICLSQQLLAFLGEDFLREVLQQAV